MAKPDLAAILPRMPFFATHGMRVLSAAPGAVIVEMPYDARFSAPPDLFPAYLLGALGDVAAVASCYASLPDGHASSTIDFTVKMLAAARGDKIIARGRVLSAGKINSTGAADVFAVANGVETHAATVLATTRNYPIR
jgi:uncharacterized protein (TIGR00369 family)